jgi:hypothetical protein
MHAPYSFITRRSLEDRRRLVAFIAFYTVLANIPFWLAAHAFALLNSGCFSIDLILAGLCALVVPPAASAPILLVCIAADILSAVCQTYFLTLQACFVDPRLVHAFSPARKLAFAAVCLLAPVAAAMAALLSRRIRRPSLRKPAAAWLLAFAAVLICVDCTTVFHTTGHIPNPFAWRIFRAGDEVNPGWSRVPRLTRIPLIRLVQLARVNLGIRARESNASALPVSSAAAAGLQAIAFQPHANSAASLNIVLIVVESWGVAADAKLNQALTRPYRQPQLLARYDIREGSVPFYGSTVEGEARELCGNHIGLRLLTASAAELNACLPATLARSGYDTSAIHGMDGPMFDRDRWYVTIGFQETRFHDGFRRDSLPDCPGAFNGTCDAAIAGWLAQRLGQRSAHPQFVHWVTLNSHLPVLVPSPLANAAPCTPDLEMSPGTALCSWYQLAANVHQSIARTASSQLARPTLFIIVGDHAPPFFDPDTRSRFSGTSVPYVLLVPRFADPRNAVAPQ